MHTTCLGIMCDSLNYFRKNEWTLDRGIWFSSEYFQTLQLNKMSRKISISEMLWKVSFFIHVESFMNQKSSSFPLSNYEFRCLVKLKAKDSKGR